MKHSGAISGKPERCYIEGVNEPGTVQLAGLHISTIICNPEIGGSV